MRPSAAVIRPISAIETSTPSEKTSDSRKARPVEASSLGRDEPDDQRHAGQVTRAEDDADDAPAEGGQQGPAERLAEPVAEAGEDLLQHAAPLRRRELREALLHEQRLDVLLRVEAGVAVELGALVVEEDLRRDVLDAVLAARARRSSQTS